MSEKSPPVWSAKELHKLRIVDLSTECALDSVQMTTDGHKLFGVLGISSANVPIAD